MPLMSGRSHLPRDVMAAACAAIALHGLASWVLGATGWVGRGPASTPVGTVAATGAGLQVRLTGGVQPLASQAASSLEREAAVKKQDEAVVDAAQRLLSLAPPAAGGAALLASTYLSADELDQGPVPEPGWILDEAVLGQVGRARMRLRLWVSEHGHIDRVEVVQAEPPGDWVEQAIRPLPGTRMRPAQRDGAAVAASIVVELAADLETMR